MNEPSNFFIILVGSIIAWVGPTVGPLLLLVFSATVGSALAMGEHDTRTRWEGVKFIMMGVAISFVLSGAAVWAVQQYTSIPANVALMPLSFVIAMSRNQLVKLVDLAVGALGTFFTAFANRKGGGQ